MAVKVFGETKKVDWQNNYDDMLKISQCKESSVGGKKKVKKLMTVRSNIHDNRKVYLLSNQNQFLLLNVLNFVQQILLKR